MSREALGGQGAQQGLPDDLTTSRRSPCRRVVLVGEFFVRRVPSSREEYWGAILALAWKELMGTFSATQRDLYLQKVVEISARVHIHQFYTRPRDFLFRYRGYCSRCPSDAQPGCRTGGN